MNSFLYKITESERNKLDIHIVTIGLIVTVINRSSDDNCANKRKIFCRFSDHYFVGAAWPNDETLMIMWTNRVQNESITSIYNLTENDLAPNDVRATLHFVRLLCRR